jgi:ABC-type transport system substrate-binding protein
LAANALVAGEIDVLDRVFPAELERLRNDPQIVVRPYVVPSIHVLIPNPRNVFMRDSGYRRSLVYGIDRQRIVRQVICGGLELQGYTPISGPLPTGSDENDLIGYGYNDRVELIPYSAGMAIVLPAQVVQGLRARAAEEYKRTRLDELNGLEENQQFELIKKWLDEDPALREPKIVLLHPSTEMATVCCQSIQQMLMGCGRDVELRALPPGITRPTDDDYDLLYAEFTMEEPLVDLRMVLGELGLAKHVSPTVQQLLAELDVARNWVQARQLLRQIHDQCNADASVLPLWQTINFYAYRRNVTGLGESQVRLYDNVDRWKIEPRTRQ